MSGERRRVQRVMLPGRVYDEIEAAARARGVAPVDLVRRIVTLGLVAIAIEDDPSADLIVRDATGERVLVLVDAPEVSA